MCGCARHQYLTLFREDISNYFNLQEEVRKEWILKGGAVGCNTKARVTFQSMIQRSVGSFHSLSGSIMRKLALNLSIRLCSWVGDLGKSAQHK